MRLQNARPVFQRILAATGIFLLLSVAAFAAPVRVYVSPPSVNIPIGGSASLDVFADIPDPILGWGLDLSVDPAVASITGVTVGSLWQPALSTDGDDLVGLAFPDPLSENAILLFTVTFQALSPGTAPLTLSFTPDDFSEGFALLDGGFSLATFEPGVIEVADPAQVPETRTAGLVLFGLFLIGAPLCLSRARP